MNGSVVAPAAAEAAAPGPTLPVVDVAVVIVNYNTADHLRACLGSLFQGGGLAGIDARVWVVDNGSADGSAAMVRAQFPTARLIESGGNPGYAAANNLALRSEGFRDGGAATVPTARHVLLLNPDTIVPAGAVAGLLAALRAEPDVGVVGPKLLLADGTLDLACRRGFPTPAVAFYRFSGLARRFPRSRRFGRYNLTYLDPDAPADVDAVVGACMLVRGAALAAAGLLDERFWMYGEDLDWCLRIHQAGWRVVYRPAVVVHHVKRAASKGSRKADFEFQRAMWLFYAKHYAEATPWPVHALVVLGLALRGGPQLAREMWAGAPRRAVR